MRTSEQGTRVVPTLLRACPGSASRAVPRGKGSRLAGAPFLCCLLALACGPGEKEPIRIDPDGPINVVVVLIDTARADYMDFYGGPGSLTPFLSEVAAESTLLTRAYSTSSWTAPSTASLFTGQYPNEHGVVEGFFVRQKRLRAQGQDGGEALEVSGLPEQTETLPELFKRNGYATFGLASNPNICLPMGFGRGFDRFHQENYERAGDMFARLRAWRSEIENPRPHFIYLHLSDPHEPYGKWEEFYVEPEDEADEMKARYWSELRYVDVQLRQICQWLNAQENTLLVVVSDHGEEFSDHGDTGHKPQLYNELTQVVMLYRAPELGIVAQEVDVNVSLIDVLPTLVDLAGLDGGSLERGAGRSLAPLLQRDPGHEALTEELRDRTLFAHRLAHDGGQWWAAMYRNWKLIERPDQSLELFDHAGDPAELEDVIAQHAEVSAPLIDALGEHKAFQPETSGTKVEIELDEELKRTLEALGYAE